MGAPIPDLIGSNKGNAGGTTATTTVSAASGTVIKFGITVVTNIFAGPLPVLSVTGTGGLTWDLIGAASGASEVNSRYYNTSAWWAAAPSGLFSASIEITSTLAIDCWVSAWESVAGCVSPFIDPNGALPIEIFYNGPSDTPQVGVYSTTDYADQLFAFVGTNYILNYGASTSPPGGAVVISDSQGGTGINTAYLGLLTVPVPAAQSSLTWGNNGATTVDEENWSFVGSALVGTPPSNRQLFLNPGPF